MFYKIINIRIVVLLVVSFLMGTTTTNAQDSSLTIHSNSQKDGLKGQHLSIYIDSSNSLSAQQIIYKIKTPNTFCPVNTTPYNIGHLGENYWMYFEIDDTINSLLFLEAPDFHVNDIEVYQVNKDKVQQIGTQGYFIDFSKRIINYKNPIFEINPKVSEGFLVKMNSKFGSSYKLYLTHPSKKLSFTADEYLRLGIYYGILLIMLIYNLFIYFISKNKSYIFYVVYVASCIWYSFFTDGIGFQYLWPNSPHINELYSFADLALIISFSAYSIYFLAIKNTHPRLFIGIISSIIVYLFIFIVNQLFEPFHQLATWTYLLPYALIVYAIFLRYQEGQKDLRFFIIAYSLLSISVLIHILMRKGIFPDNFYGIYAVNIGFVLEVLFLSFAQGDRVRILYRQQIENQNIIIEKQKENEALKDKVNKELEILVEKRTLEIKQKKEELADSYKKLEYLNTQINEMNKVLDINVYKLKREVVDTQKTVILEKSVDYDAFIKAFPSDLTCNRYLSEKKWGNGFICKKCGNDKASKTSNSEQKKCTKCDTIESLTAGTIFHRLRFPIQKAFYISIVTFKNHSVSNKDLAEKLEIGENTISSFRKKVKDKMAEENPINFEELIF